MSQTLIKRADVIKLAHAYIEWDHEEPLCLTTDFGDWVVYDHVVEYPSRGKALKSVPMSAFNYFGLREQFNINAVRDENDSVHWDRFMIQFNKVARAYNEPERQ